MTYRKQQRKDTAMNKYLKEAIGPRAVGGTYRSAYWRRDYTVTAIDVTDDGAWSMTVQWEDGRVTTHCTAWDYRCDVVVFEPAISR